jgi:hypothetical protein
MAGKSVNKEWLANLRTIVLDRTAMEQLRPPCIYFDGAALTKLLPSIDLATRHKHTTQTRFFIGKVLHIRRDYFVQARLPSTIQST